MTNKAPTPQKNKDIWKILVPIAAMIAVTAIGLQFLKWRLHSEDQSPIPGQIESLDVGTVLPDLPLKTLDGQSTRVSQLGAKVVLLNFWATWCEACMVEMPSIVKLQQQYREKGLKVVAVNLDEKPESVVPKTVKKLGMDSPIYVDSDGTLSNLFDVHAIPLTLIFNKDRKVLLIEGGERDWAGKDVQEMMNRWLGE